MARYPWLTEQLRVLKRPWRECLKAAVAQVTEWESKKLYVKRVGRVVETNPRRAEVCFAPNKIGSSEKVPVYRHLAARDPLRQLEVPEIRIQRSFFAFYPGFERSPLQGFLGSVTKKERDGGS